MATESEMEREFLNRITEVRDMERDADANTRLTYQGLQIGLHEAIRMVEDYEVRQMALKFAQLSASGRAKLIVALFELFDPSAVNAVEWERETDSPNLATALVKLMWGYVDSGCGELRPIATGFESDDPIVTDVTAELWTVT